MAIIKITKDGESNEILASLAWAKSAYPNHTCEDVTKYPSEDDLLDAKKADARRWRNGELNRTDTLSLLTDHPQKQRLQRTGLSCATGLARVIFPRFHPR